MQIETNPSIYPEYFYRIHEDIIREDLTHFPVVAILGPRQCGKSTLAKQIIQSVANSVYLDMELPSDRNKLDDPELFFSYYRHGLVCLDEIQLRPDLFPILRSMADRSGRGGQFLILGSVAPDLLKQGNETLAGRIAFHELTPFQLSELPATVTLTDFWVRGGFPRSLLAINEKRSSRWRSDFIKTFVERDLVQWGVGINPHTFHEYLRILPHYHGQLINYSKIAQHLGVSHTTVQHYTSLMEKFFLLRLLKPEISNHKKRLVKSPKVFFRDSGLLHSLLRLESFNDLLGHPVLGDSWEGFAIENIVNQLPDWTPHFYRSANGAEIDLVLSRGDKCIAVELKANKVPKPEKGFYIALEDMNISEAWIIAPIDGTYPLKENVKVSGLKEFIEQIKTLK